MGIQTIKPYLTLFVGAFATLIWCGDRNFKIRFKINLKERKEGWRGRIGEVQENMLEERMK
jgi:hypothetical protein